MKMMKKLWIVFIVIITKLNFVIAQSNIYGPFTYTVSPMPIAGQFPAGTQVDVCFTMDGYNSVASLWFEGFSINLGQGWLNGSIQPVLFPNECSTTPNGNWVWQSLVNVGGNIYGPGYFL
jgi:hypothetical protein